MQKYVVDAGVLSLYFAGDKRIEYSLTESGRELRKIVLELLEWSPSIEGSEDEPCVIMRKKES